MVLIGKERRVNVFFEYREGTRKLADAFECCLSLTPPPQSKPSIPGLLKIASSPIRLAFAVCVKDAKEIWSLYTVN